MSRKRREVGSRKSEVGSKNGSGWSCSHFPLSTSHFRAGFTLVELLVVIAILGILVSLVTAGAQAARRRAAVTKA
ncbi:MAG: type II secretion system protein, partial [Candidatus Omnitrophica bacterium]|nr:type II secretion system protein [Candidatus Omnitrophota bacterium]